MTDISQINESSLTSVHFLDKDIHDLNLSFRNIVFTNNGAYIVLNNELGLIADKIPYVDYKNSSLLSIPSSPYMVTFIPKPPITILSEILEMFKYVSKENKLELAINVYWNKRKKRFVTEICDQIITTGRVEYSYTDKYELNTNYVRYLQIHSHHGMAAAFSSIDNDDEQNSLFSFFGVIGKINQKSELFNIDKKFRIWTGIRFINLEVKDVFELDKYTKQISNETVTRLDQIIQDSKQHNITIAKYDDTFDFLNDINSTKLFNGML
jgi:hypothetical protein